MAVFYGTQDEYSKFALVQQKQLASQATAAKSQFKSESDQLRDAAKRAERAVALIQGLNSSQQGNYGVGSPLYVELSPEASLSSGVKFKEQPAFMRANNIVRYKEDPSLAGVENPHLAYNTPDPFVNMANATIYRDIIKEQSEMLGESPERQARFKEIGDFYEKYKLEGDITDELNQEKFAKDIKAIPKKELEYMNALKEQDKSFYNKATSIYFKDKQIRNQASDEFLRRIGKSAQSGPRSMLTEDEIMQKGRAFIEDSFSKVDDGIGVDMPKLVESLQWMKEKKRQLEVGEIRKQEGGLSWFKNTIANWLSEDTAIQNERDVRYLGLDNEVFRPNIDEDSAEEFEVVKVLDGDTFVVKDASGARSVIRSLGLDTYEYIDTEDSNKMERLELQAKKNNISIDEAKSLGEEAFLRAKSLLEGKKITAFRSEIWDDQDVYGRSLREILVDGKRYSDAVQGKRGDANIYAKDMNADDTAWFTTYGESIGDSFMTALKMVFDASDFKLYSTAAIDNEIERVENLIRAVKEKPIDPKRNLNIIEKEALNKWENADIQPALSSLFEGLVIYSPQIVADRLTLTGAGMAATGVGFLPGMALMAAGLGLSIFDPTRARMSWTGNRRANVNWLIENTGLSYFNREDFDVARYMYDFYKPYTREQLDTIEDEEVRKAYEEQLAIKDQIGRISMATRVGETTGTLVSELLTIFRKRKVLAQAGTAHLMHMNKAKKLNLDFNKGFSTSKYLSAALAPRTPKDKRVWQLVDNLRGMPIKGYNRFEDFVGDMAKKHSKLGDLLIKPFGAGLEGMTVWAAMEAFKYNPDATASEIVASMMSGAFFHGIESLIGIQMGNFFKRSMMQGKSGQLKNDIQELLNHRAGKGSAILSEGSNVVSRAEGAASFIGYTVGGLLAQPVQGIGAKMPFIDPMTADWSHFWQRAGEYASEPGEHISFAGMEVPLGSEELFTDLVTGVMFGFITPLSRGYKTFSDYQRFVENNAEIYSQAKKDLEKRVKESKEELKTEKEKDASEAKAEAIKKDLKETEDLFENADDDGMSQLMKDLGLDQDAEAKANAEDLALQFEGEEGSIAEEGFDPKVIESFEFERADGKVRKDFKTSDGGTLSVLQFNYKGQDLVTYKGETYLLDQRFLPPELQPFFRDMRQTADSIYKPEQRVNYNRRKLREAWLTQIQELLPTQGDAVVDAQILSYLSNLRESATRDFGAQSGEFVAHIKTLEDRLNTRLADITKADVVALKQASEMLNNAIYAKDIKAESRQADVDMDKVKGWKQLPEANVVGDKNSPDFRTGDDTADSGPINEVDLALVKAAVEIIARDKKINPEIIKVLESLPSGEYKRIAAHYSGMIFIAAPRVKSITQLRAELSNSIAHEKTHLVRHLKENSPEFKAIWERDVLGTLPKKVMDSVQGSNTVKAIYDDIRARMEAQEPNMDEKELDALSWDKTAEEIFAMLEGEIAEAKFNLQAYEDSQGFLRSLFNPVIKWFRKMLGLGESATEQEYQMLKDNIEALDALEASDIVQKEDLTSYLPEDPIDEIVSKFMAQNMFADFSTSYDRMQRESPTIKKMMNTDTGASILGKAVLGASSVSDLVDKVGSMPYSNLKERVSTYFSQSKKLGRVWSDEEIEDLTDTLYTTFHPEQFEDNDYVIANMFADERGVKIQLSQNKGNNSVAGEYTIDIGGTELSFSHTKVVEAKRRKRSPNAKRASADIGAEYGNMAIAGGILSHVSDNFAQNQVMSVEGSAGVLAATNAQGHSATVQDLTANGLGVFDMSGRTSVPTDKFVLLNGKLKKIAFYEGGGEVDIYELKSDKKTENAKVYYRFESESFDEGLLADPSNRVMEHFFEQGIHPSLGHETMHVYPIQSIKARLVERLGEFAEILESDGHTALSSTPRGIEAIKALANEVRNMEIENFYAFMATDYAYDRYLRGLTEKFVTTLNTSNIFADPAKGGKDQALHLVDFEKLKTITREGKEAGYLIDNFQKSKSFANDAMAINDAIKRAYLEFTEHQSLSDELTVGELVKTLLPIGERQSFKKDGPISDMTLKQLINALQPVVNAEGKQTPPEVQHLPQAVQKALRSYYIASAQNTIDLHLRRMLNRAGEEFLAFYGEKKKASKYTEKYGTFITTDDRVSLSKVSIDPLLKKKGFVKDNIPTVKSVFVEDGEYATKAYLLDPDSWAKFASTLSGVDAKQASAFAETMKEFAKYVGEDRIDGGSLYIMEPDAPESENLMSFMGAVTGKKSHGSIKTRMLKSMNGSKTRTVPLGKSTLHYQEAKGSLILKHAFHPFRLPRADEPQPKEGSPLDILNKLARTLKDNKIDIITFPSALKQQGVSQAGKFTILNERGTPKLSYEIDTKGNLLRDVKQKPKEGEPQMAEQESTFIPGGMVINPSRFNSKEYDPEFSAQLRTLALTIPLTGDGAMTWSEQKNAPTMLASGMPTEMLSFGPFSDYLKLKTNEKWFKEYEKEAAVLGVKPIANAYEAFLANKERHGTQASHLLLGRQVMAEYLQNMLQNKSNAHIEKDEQKKLALYYTLSALRDRLMVKKAANEGRYEDLELGVHENMSDYFKQDLSEQALQALNNLLGISDEFRFASTYNRATSLLGEFENARLSKSPDQNKNFKGVQLNLEYLPTFLMHSEGVMYKNAYKIEELPTEKETAFAAAFKQVIYNGEHNRNTGSIITLAPDVRNRKEDISRAIRWGKENGRIDEAAMREFAEDHKLEDNYYGVTVSEDVMAKHPHWVVGERVFSVLTPPDNAVSFVPVMITGILPKEFTNTVIMASDLTIKYLGRDHDIDTMSLMGMDAGPALKGGRVKGSMWARIGAPLQEGQLNYKVLWNALKDAKIREGVTKDKLIKGKENAPQTFEPVQITKNRTAEVPFQDFNALPDFPELHNNYSKRIGEVLGPLSLGSSAKRRRKFSTKQIGIAAAVGKAAADWYNSLPNKTGRISITAPQSIGGKASESGVKLSVRFKIDPGDMSRYNYHHAWLKEAAVDAFQLHSYYLKPYEWIANYLVTEVEVKVGEGYRPVAQAFHKLGSSEREEAIKNAIKYALANEIDKFQNRASVSSLTHKNAFKELDIAAVDRVRKRYFSAEVSNEKKTVLSNLVNEFFIDKASDDGVDFKEAMVQTFNSGIGIDVQYAPDTASEANPYYKGTLAERFLYRLFNSANDHQILTGHKSFPQYADGFRKQVVRKLSMNIETMNALGQSWSSLAITPGTPVNTMVGRQGPVKAFAVTGRPIHSLGLFSSAALTGNVSPIPRAHYATRQNEYDRNLIWKSIAGALSFSKIMADNFASFNKDRKYIPDLFDLKTLHDDHIWGSQSKHTTDNLYAFENPGQGAKDVNEFRSSTTEMYNALLETYLNTPSNVESVTSPIDARDADGNFIYTETNPYVVPMTTQVKAAKGWPTKRMSKIGHNPNQEGTMHLPVKLYVDSLKRLRTADSAQMAVVKAGMEIYKKQTPDGGYATYVSFQISGAPRVRDIELTEFLFGQDSPHGLYRLTGQSYAAVGHAVMNRPMSNQGVVPLHLTKDRKYTMDVDGTETEVNFYNVHTGDDKPIPYGDPFRDALTYHEFIYSKVLEGLLFGNTIHKTEGTLPYDMPLSTVPANIVGHAPLSRQDGFRLSANVIHKTVQNVIHSAVYGTDAESDHLKQDLLYALAEIKNVTLKKFDPDWVAGAYRAASSSWSKPERQADLYNELMTSVVPVIYGQALNGSIGNASRWSPAAYRDLAYVSQEYADRLLLPFSSAVSVMRQRMLSSSAEGVPLSTILDEVSTAMASDPSISQAIRSYNTALLKQGVNIGDPRDHIAAVLNYIDKEMFKQKIGRIADPKDKASVAAALRNAPSFLSTPEGETFYSELQRRGVEPKMLMPDEANPSRTRLEPLDEALMRVSSSAGALLVEQPRKGAMYRTGDMSLLNLNFSAMQNAVYSAGAGIYKGFAKVNGKADAKAFMDDFKQYLLGRGISAEDAEMLSQSPINLEYLKQVSRNQDYRKLSRLRALQRQVKSLSALSPEEHAKFGKLYDEVLSTPGAWQSLFPDVMPVSEYTLAIGSQIKELESRHKDFGLVDLLKNFVSDKIAEVSSKNPGDKAVTLELLDGQSANLDDLLLSQAKQKLAMFADRTEYLVGEIDKAQPYLARIMMNSLAENIYEMHNIYKAYDKVKARAYKAAALSNKDQTISQTSAEQILAELNPFQRNNPMSLADLFSSQQGVLPSDQVLTFNEYATVDDDGNLVKAQEAYFAGMLDNETVLPVEGQKLASELLTAQSTSFKEAKGIISPTVPRPVLTSPAKIVMQLANNLVSLSRLGEKDMTSALNEFVNSLSSEAAETFTSSNIAKALGVLSRSIVSGDANSSIFFDNVTVDGKVKAMPRLRIKYFKTKSGVVKPYVEFTGADNMVHKGIFGKEGEESWTDFVRAVEIFVSEKAAGDSRLKEGLQNVESQLPLNKALSGFLSLKLYNAYRGLQSFSQASRLKSLAKSYERIVHQRNAEEGTPLFDKQFPQVAKLIKSLEKDYEDSFFGTQLDRLYDSNSQVDREAWEENYADYVSKLASLPKQMTSSTQRALNQTNIVNFLDRVKEQYGSNVTDMSPKDYSEYLELVNYYNENRKKKLSKVNANFAKNLKAMQMFYKHKKAESLADSLKFTEELDVWDPYNPELAMSKINIAGEAIPYVGGPQDVYFDVSPASIARSSEQLDKAFLAAGTTILERMYRANTMTDGAAFQHIFGSSAKLGKENFLVINETLGMLASIKGENYVFGAHRSTAQGHSEKEIGRFARTFAPGERLEFTDESGNVGRGLFVGERDGQIIYADIDNKVVSYVRVGELSSISKGLSLPQLDRSINQNFEKIFGQTAATHIMDSIDETFTMQKEYDILAAEDAGGASIEARALKLKKRTLYFEALESHNKVASENNTFLQEQMHKASSSLAKMQYLGAQHLVTAGLGTIGGVITSLAAVAGLAPLALPASLFGLAVGSLVFYGKKISTNYARNYTSATREVIAMSGVFDTIQLALKTTEDSTPESENARRTSYMTFAQDEVKVSKSIGKLGQEPVQAVYEALKKANQFIPDDELLEKIEQIRTVLQDPDAELDYALSKSLADQVHLKFAETMKSDGSIPEDIIAAIDKLSYVPELNKFIYENGHDIASLTKLRRQMQIQAREAALTVGHVVPRSEDTSRKFGEKLFTDLFIRHSLQDHLSPQQMTKAIEDLMNLSVGEYGGATRTVMGRGALGRVMGLYGRFSRYNTSYYLSGIIKELERQDFVKGFASLNPESFDIKKGGYDTIKEYVVGSKEHSLANKGFNFDIEQQLGRKITYAAAVALSSKLASGGLIVMLSALGMPWLAEMLGIVDKEEEGALQAFEDFTGFSGIFTTMITGVINTGTMMVFAEESYVNSMKPDQYKKYWENVMKFPTEFLYYGGLGSGYSSGLGAVAGTAMNYALYNVRGDSRAAKIGKIDNVQKEIWGDMTNGILQSMGYLALPYQYSKIGVEGGYAAFNPEQPKQIADIYSLMY